MRKYVGLLLSVLLSAVLMIWNPKQVFAGEVSSVESQVLAALSNVYEYNGESYKALPSYIEQCRTYLEQDNVDLSQEECTALIAMIEVNIPTVVENGYFQKVSGTSSEQDASGENEEDVSYLDEPESTQQEEQNNSKKNESKKNKGKNQQKTSESETGKEAEQEEEDANTENTASQPSADENEEVQKKKNPASSDVEIESEVKAENSDEADGNEVSSDENKETESSDSELTEEQAFEFLYQADEERRQKETRNVIIIVVVVCLLFVAFCLARMIHRHYVLYLSHRRASSKWKPKHLTDVHCHLLPGVDDGSVHMDMTRNLLKLEIKNGVDTIVCTPHFKRGRSRFDREKIVQIFEDVKEEALKLNPKMKLYLGEELYYDHSLCSAIEEGKALKINGTDYALVEFSPEVEYKTIHKACQSLTMAGILPILAHIERYPSLISKEDHLMEIHEMGVYYQMNITSIMGSNVSGRIYRQKKLLADGWIDFIASDSHDDKSRTPKFKKAWRELLRLCDDEMIERIMWKNPAKLLAGENID